MEDAGVSSGVATAGNEENDCVTKAVAPTLIPLPDFRREELEREQEIREERTRVRAQRGTSSKGVFIAVLVLFGVVLALALGEASWDPAQEVVDDSYSILELPKDASDKDIRRAYRRLSREWYSTSAVARCAVVPRSTFHVQASGQEQVS